MKLQPFVLLVLLFPVLILTGQSQSPPILFIYDASGSMWGQIDGKAKMQIATEVLTTTISTLDDQQQIGLMAYGHRREKDCSDVELMINLSNTAKSEISTQISTIKPLGRTPLAKSAEIAIESIKTEQVQATVILITDGIESCDGDICQVVQLAKAEGVDFKMHIVGFGLKEENTSSLKCAAAAAGGHYYTAENASGLSEALAEVLEEATVPRVRNFSVFATKDGQPLDVSVKAYLESSAIPADNTRSYADTAFLNLPEGSYRVKVTPLENSEIKARTVKIDILDDQRKHIEVSFNEAVVKFDVTNNGAPLDGLVKFYDNNTGKRYTQKRTYGKTQQVEIEPGNYKIVFDPLKIKGAIKTYEIEEYEVNGGEEQHISHDFDSSDLFVKVQNSEGDLIDAVLKIYATQNGRQVDTGRTYLKPASNPNKFILSPGNYKVDVKCLGDYKGQLRSMEVTLIKGEIADKVVIIE